MHPTLENPGLEYYLEKHCLSVCLSESHLKCVPYDRRSHDIFLKEDLHYSNVTHTEALGVALRLSCLLLSSREVTRSLKDFSSSKRMNTGEKVSPPCFLPRSRENATPASGWGAGELGAIVLLHP